GLPRRNGGTVRVSSQTELEQVLAHEGSDLSSQMIEFVSQRWPEADDADLGAPAPKWWNGPCEFADRAGTGARTRRFRPFLANDRVRVAALARSRRCRTVGDPEFPGISPGAGCGCRSAACTQ